MPSSARAAPSTPSFWVSEGLASCDLVNATSTHSALVHSDVIDHTDDNPEQSIEDDEDQDDEDSFQNSDTIEGEEESDDMDDLRIDNFNIYSGEEYVGPLELEVEEQEHFIGESHKTKVLFKIYLQEEFEE